MDRQFTFQIYAERTYETLIKACGTGIQQGNAARTCSIQIQHGHVHVTDMLLGAAA
jgi:hypothetical protein